MEEQLITFETAKLAKVKGFDIEVFRFYHKESLHPIYEYELCNYNLDIKSNLNCISAPTQSLLQKWLREKHNKHVIIIPIIIPSNEIKYYIFKGKLKWNWNELFDTYELALEVGLQKALKLI